MPVTPAPVAAAEPEPEQEPDPLERELISFFNDMQCQNHWQVLGLGRNASVEEIDRAYQDRCQRFHPERFQHILAGDFQEKLSSVRARLTEAFVTLSSKSSTKAYDRMVVREGQYEEKRESWEAIPSAAAEPALSGIRGVRASQEPRGSEGALQKAKRAYQEQDFWRTIELCRSSIELSEDNDPERFHLLGTALSENPRWRQDAEQNLKIAHNLKPWQPRYLVSLAKFYEKVGLKHRAERMYEQIRVMDPDFKMSDDLEDEKATDDGETEVLDEKAV